MELLLYNTIFTVAVEDNSFTATEELNNIAMSYLHKKTRLIINRY